MLTEKSAGNTLEFIPKRPYICGPLTELNPEVRTAVKELYVRLADICLEVIGMRAFVPHEHCDPVAHAKLAPLEVYMKEKPQICSHTNLLVVVAIEPTWGGGMEVAWAENLNIPILILAPRDKKISRLLQGPPAIRATLRFENIKNAAEIFKTYLSNEIEPIVAELKSKSAPENSENLRRRGIFYKSLRDRLISEIAQ